MDNNSDDDMCLDDLVNKNKKKNNHRYERQQSRDKYGGNKQNYNSKQYYDNRNKHHNNNKNYNKYDSQKSNKQHKYEDRQEEEDWGRDLDLDNYNKFIQQNLAKKKYGIIFLGTNDYEKDFFQIEEQLQNENQEENDKISTAMLVSNGWIYVLDSLFKSHKNIENVVLYDMNPAMLIVYDLIHKMLMISESRQEFISNCFCRKFNDDINSNDLMLEYLKQPHDIYLFESVLEKLDNVDKEKQIKSSIAFKEILFKYAAEKTETRQLYPLYIWDEKQMYIDGRKMHTTHKQDRVYDFFTTFYYSILSPFQNDEQYIVFRDRMLKCQFKFIASNLYHIFEDEFLQKHKQDSIVTYIDGIDDETCYYLKNKREFLFKKLQEFQYNHIKIISTKSGITNIRKDEIETDKKFQIYPYKRELSYGNQQVEKYSKAIQQMINLLNQ